MAPVSIKTAKPVKKARPIVGRIIVYHSAYEGALLRLTVYSRDDETVAPGLPLKLVRDACFIVANNTDGNLEQRHRDEAGVVRSRTPVVLEVDALLTPGEYTYRVNGIPCGFILFQEETTWTPPYTLRTHWQDVDGLSISANLNMIREETASAASGNVKILDKACVMTGALDRLHASHLVPEAEEDWWVTHNMFHSAGPTANTSTTVSSNLISLRSDLNGAGFDDAHFVLYPYAGKWVTLFVSPGSPDLALEYDFRAIRMPQRIQPLFLWARFAWNIFKLMGEELELMAQDGCIKHEQPRLLKRKARAQGGRGVSGAGGNGSSGAGGSGGPETCEGPPAQREGDMQAKVEGSLRAPYRFPSAQIDAWETIEEDMKENGIESMGPIYVGLAQTWRVAEKYLQDNPAVSAVRGNEFAPEEDDEQDLTGLEP
ncbi:hypothetical protein B0H17DRAFT_1139749 [Mycena rosella]|uniref:HNH nuclease domain-containing protein n=1 Tax=Mycena rosella TaxID=1033263 RepID=A0AAD7D4U1_MYCRO|nr:hypothetical protein B0H17DRAFT_1139749 [Mycena rosella]